MDMLSSITAAIWLGILTSISPCPLATNIAAVSFVARRIERPFAALGAGVLYALGRSAAYIVIAILLVSAVVSAPSIANFLQSYMNSLLGPLLVITGLFLLGAINIRTPRSNIAAKLQGRAETLGSAGAVLLGVLFAVSFCPVSAALFFGSLIPLAIQKSSPVFIPLLYGLGTAIPVILFSFLIAAGAESVGRAFNIVTKIERWARRITAATFVLVGIYFIAAYILGLNI